MADTVTLIPKGDADTAQEIIDAFAERTGLDHEQAEDGEGVVFDVSDDHELEVVQTLTEIDPDWTDHLEVGQPL
jgi:hypothetical protein